MRLYKKALIREMTATSAIALGALSALIIVTQIVRILGNAAVGEISVGAVLPFLAFGYLRFLPVLLSLALFIGVLLSLGRAWQDSEMVIWSGSGIGPLAWIDPVLRFALPITLIIATMSLVMIPWGARQKAEYERFLANREEIAALVPGVFAESNQGSRVYFVESLNESGPSVRNVFIQSEQQGRVGIVVASEGEVSRVESGDHFLVLSQGRRYEGMPGTADYKVMEFDRYGFRLDPSQMTPAQPRPRELGTLALLSNPSAENLAEAVWRIGYPLSAVVLALLAIPLSFYNPRAGRSFNILFAALVYSLYNNVIGLSQNWVARGQMDAVNSMAAVHGGAIVVLVAAFWWRYGKRPAWRTR